jgi:hypothetical protein
MPLCLPCSPGEAEPLAPVGGWECEACSRLLVQVFWSMTSLRGAALWVVADRYDGKPFAEGVAYTELEACTAAHAATSQRLPAGAAVIFKQWSNAMAEKRAREMRAEARALRPGTPAGPQVVEYVYRHNKHRELFADHFTWVTTKAKILRKTAKQVFIEDTANTYTTARGVLVLRTQCLSRAELERTGKSRGWVTTPYPPEDANASRPAWADVLDLKVPCTLAEGKRAYRRKAAAAHPDKGGSEVAFRRIAEAFEAAKLAVGCG